MRSVILFLLSFLIISAVKSQPFSFNQGGALQKNYYEEIPYEVSRSKIFVWVEIAGKKHRFLFDTGAPMCISEGLAEELKLQELHRAFTKDGNGQTDTLKTVNLSEIKLGNVSFANIPTLAFFPTVLKCWNLEGSIGSNLLRESIIRIDPARQVLVLTDDIKRLSIKNRDGIYMNTKVDSQSFPHINVVFKGKVNVDLGFDSGGEDFIMLSRDYVSQLIPYKVCEITDRGFGSHMISTFGIGHADSIYRIGIPSLTVADAVFNKVVVETTQSGMSRIGAKLLDYGSVTLDFIHHKFYFEAKQNRNDLQENFWPISPVISQGKLLVGVVWGSMREQVKPGEQILQVGDTSFAKIDLCDWLDHNYWSALQGETAIKVQSMDGTVRGIKMIKQ